MIQLLAALLAIYLAPDIRHARREANLRHWMTPTPAEVANWRSENAQGWRR